MPFFNFHIILGVIIQNGAESVRVAHLTNCSENLFSTSQCKSGLGCLVDALQKPHIAEALSMQPRRNFLV